jgi:hypothetical protein
MYTPSWVAAILDSASKVLPLVVAVSGRVGSDTPLICQQSGMRGVIVEETVSTDFLFHHIIIFYCEQKGSPGTAVKLLPYDHEVKGSSPRNSRLQKCRERLLS